MSKAIVYIEEMDSVADVTFPAVPQVVSLLMYDDTTRSKEHPHPPTGYPVVCVTVSVLHTLHSVKMRTTCLVFCSVNLHLFCLKRKDFSA